ncbi:hypothetical protein [Alicyclobacillus vulcanalis]|uniref:Uncharacterized protein n=1 Tax=Alicyclobacillus vulcanalis TaxID=252246 RepID=A0A1N7MEF4_9BACL|nr:hypothetical protein [Alicyclobacillus vulcanalis]SIS84361.1 hypothetical protein SAMN05421799_10583 [Alicyclobacillus vulcanalis]
MADRLQLQIRHPDHGLTERERQLIVCLVQRICVHHLQRRCDRSVHIRPANVDSIHLLVNQVIEVDPSLGEDERSEILGALADDLNHTLALCDIRGENIVRVQLA